MELLFEEAEVRVDIFGSARQDFGESSGEWVNWGENDSFFNFYLNLMSLKLLDF